MLRKTLCSQDYLKKYTEVSGSQVYDFMLDRVSYHSEKLLEYTDFIGSI